MTVSIRRSLVLLSFGLALSAALWAQAEQGAAPQGEFVFPPAGEARPAPMLDGARFWLDGRPTLLTWAFGLQSPGQLPAYRQAGFNTLYLDLDPTVNEPAARTLATAAAREGLHLIVGLDPLARAAGAGRVAADDADGLRGASDWLAQTVERWRDTPGLTAWALPHELEERLDLPPGEFAPWLAAQYGDPLNLAAAWGQPIPAGTVATPAMALTIDATRPGRLGRATLDVARWQASTLSNLLRGWARTIGGIDPARPVLGGRMSRGRTLLVAPVELAGLQPSQVPPAPDALLPAEPLELATLASQTGRYAPCVCLDGGLPAPLLIGQARRAAAGGLAALSFYDWSALQADPARLAAVTEVLAELDAAEVAAYAPQAGAAVLLSPWAAGPAEYGSGWYGYSPLGGDEPAGLVDLLRGGTRFGPLDVLTPRDLVVVDAGGAALAPRTELLRYGTIFAPAAWFLDEAQIEALTQYVEAGGTLVTDLGVASEGFRGPRPGMMPQMAGLLGVAPLALREVAEVVLPAGLRARMARVLPGEDPWALVPAGAPGPGSVVIAEKTDLAPGLTPLDNVGPRAARAQLAAPASFCAPLGGSRVIARQAEIAARRLEDISVAGWFETPTGRGRTLFASGLLWAGFGPDDPLFAPLHDGLMRYKAPLEVVSDVVPGGTWAARGADRLWLERRAPQAGLVVVDLPSDDGRVLGGGLNFLRRQNLAGEPGVEPLVNRFTTLLGAGEWRLAEALPLTAWPVDMGGAVSVVRYGPDEIELWVYGPGDSLASDGTQVRVAAPAATEVLLRLDSGVYALRPGSQQRARLEHFAARPEQTITSPGGFVPGHAVALSGARTEWQTYHVEPAGQLTLRIQSAAVRITLRPAEARWDD